MQIRRGPLLTFIVAMVGAVVVLFLRPPDTPQPGIPFGWTVPASDPRFRRVVFRQDELLDVPVLAEAFRIARAKCLLRDCKAADADAYTELFGESFFVLER